MDEKNLPKISVGIVSMTVILCVLCLTVFSVLTLSTALSEKKLAEKRADAVKEYYRAEVLAAELANGLISSEDTLAFAEEKHIDVRIEEGNRIFYFGIPIDEGQKISVELVKNETWEVICWQIVSTVDWTADESLHVWDGENLFEE